MKLKPKNPYNHISDKDYKRFMGNPLTDYIVTGILALLFCAAISLYFNI